MTKEEFFMAQALLGGRPAGLDSRTLAPPKRSYAVGEKYPPPRPLAPWPNDPTMIELMQFGIAAVRAGVLLPEADSAAHEEIWALHYEFCQWYKKQERAA